MAGKKISGITGELILNVNKWTSGIKQAQKDGKALESALKPTTQLASDAGKALTAAGLAIGGALLGASKIAANYGDSILEASEKTGITTQQLGKLKFVAEQSDTSFEGLATGLKFLSRNMLDAATGGRENERVFRALGISTKDASGSMRPLNDVLVQAADIFKRLPDGTEKSALAMKLFGKAGQDLIPFLNQGSAGIKKLGDEATALGLAIDPATAKLGDDFNNALNKSKNAALGLAVSVGNALLPALIDVTEKGTKAVAFAAAMSREYPIATKAAAGLSAVLVGAGGLALGLASVAVVAPKAAAGLTLVKGAVSSVVALAGGIIATTAAVAGLGIALGKLVFDYIDTKNAQTNLVSSTNSLANITQRLSNDLKAKGVIVDRGTDSLEKWNERVIQAAKSSGHYNTRVVETKKATGDAKTELDKLIASLMKGETATDKAAEKMKALRDSFITSLKPADDLEKTIALLGKSFSQKEILSVYGDQIIEATAKQKEHGFEVSHNVALLNAMAMGAKAVNRELDLVRADVGQVLSGRGQRTVGLDRADIGDILPETNTESRLENLIKFQKDAAFEASRTSREFQASWERSFRNVSERASDAFADMVVSGKFQFKSLTNIAKDTARDMLSSFTKGLLAPLTDSLGRLGAKLAGSLLGGGSGGGGGALGFAGSGGGGIGGMLGGLFGKGGGAAGGAAGASSSLLSSLGGVGGIAQGAGVVIDQLNKIGAGRRAADEIVKSQNAFDSALNSIVASTASNASKSDQIEKLWSDFQSNMARFAGNDPNNQKVANQAFATEVGKITQLRANYGPGPGGAGAGSTINAPMTLSLAPVFNFDGEVNALTVRDVVMPEITIVLETAVRGFAERWKQVLVGPTAGTQVPVGA